jgi:Ca2+-binding RTX toxin-like protein
VGRLALLAAALALTAASPAAAAEVYTEVGSTRNGDSYTDVVVRGAPGEANAVTVTRGESAVVVRDTGAALRPGRGCRALSEHDAECTGWFPLGFVLVIGEDGDDRLTAATSGVSLDGGPGADVLAGSDGPDGLHGGDGADRIAGGGGGDFLDGGAGPDKVTGGEGDDRITGDPPGPQGWPDVLDGGPGGLDTVSYTGRTAGLSLDLASPAPQGAPGEGDVLAGFENVYGGAGADVIRGNDGPNRLGSEPTGDGLVGAGDLVDGRGGDDDLTGSEGSDELHGGPGDDRLHGGPRDRLSCGPGRDIADNLNSTVVVPADCELVQLARVGVLLRRVGAHRLALGLTGGTGLCRVGIRIGLPGRLRPLARASVSIRDGPRTVVLRWRRTAAPRLVVSLRGTIRCRPGPRGRRLGAFAVAP